MKYTLQYLGECYSDIMFMDVMPSPFFQARVVLYHPMRPAICCTHYELQS